ncbi:ABC transporter ATP-binding protein [Aeromicrobium sp. P5_D10]
MLHVDRIHKKFAGLVALDGASLQVEQGESVGLVGPNGSGKSTLLNVITGFERPDDGTVTLGGRDITKKEPWAVADHGVRRTFQHANQPTRMTVMELMLAGGRLPVGQSMFGSIFTPGRVRREQDEALEKAWSILRRVKLDALANHPGGKISGGQQKLLGLGMALMADPKLLLLDEPTAGVNPALRVQLAEHLRDLQAEGVTVLTIEHDMRFIADVCDRVYVLDKGSVLTTCRPGELASHPEVLEAYLGRSGRDSVESAQAASKENV